MALGIYIVIALLGLMFLAFSFLGFNENSR